MFTHYWQTTELRRLTELITAHGGRIVGVCPTPPETVPGGHRLTHEQRQDRPERHRVYFEVPDQTTYDAIDTAVTAAWSDR